MFLFCVFEDAPVTLVVPSKSHPGCYVIGLDRKLVCFNWESGDIIQVGNISLHVLI